MEKITTGWERCQRVRNLPAIAPPYRHGMEHLMTERKPIDCWLTDMDGVLVHEGHVVRGADEFVSRLGRLG
jgi:hypothetical protein